MVYKKLLIFFSLLSIVACTEEMEIDTPEGKKVPVVEGYLTDEVKQHEVILSYSSDLYSLEREMIPNAVVYVAGGGDTIYYHEQKDNPGHYLTDSVAGKKNRRYHLDIRVAENTLSTRTLHMQADLKMPNNANCIDSIRLLRKHDQQDIPFVEDTTAVRICPYFQTLSDPEIVYNV